MTSWKFLHLEKKEKENEADSWFTEYKNFTDVPKAQVYTMVKETMFDNFYPESILNELTKCVRVLPHHQNTSGFFITVIEKIAELDKDEPKLATEEMKEPTDDLVIQKDDKKRDFDFLRCDGNDPDIQYIKAYYGLTSINNNQLVCQDPISMSRVYVMNKELSRFLHADVKHQLNIISLGTTMLQKNKTKGGGGVECIFRVSQDGVGFLVDKMERRLIRTKSVADFKRFIMRKYHEVSDFEDAEMKVNL